MTKICKIEDCGSSYRVKRGWCNKHYLRWMRYGDTKRGRIRQSEESQKKRSESLKQYYAENPERGKRHSEIMKNIRHSGNFKKGFTPWNKGRKWPERSGENHHLWKGGVTKQEKIDRVLFRQTVLQLVLQRDNYTCQICNEYGVNLNVDHIKSWAKYPNLRFDLDNCRTLCRVCHYYVTFKRKMPSGSKWGMMSVTRGRIAP